MKSPLTAALWLFATATLLAQWRPSPFPATAPVAGYVLQNAFPSHAALPPWQLVNLTTNAGRLFVVEKNGRVYVITNAATPTKSLFLDNSADTFNVGESGMFGIAFHPTGNWVFAWANETNRTTAKMEGRLSRWTIDPSNTNRVLANSKFVLIAQLDEELTHSGGDIKFGPDGYLYVPLGDEGGGRGRLGNTQRIDRDFYSGILRIDVDELPGNLAPNPHPAVRGGYLVPADNPWVGATTFNTAAINTAALRTEFWAVGMRNPYRMSFDSLTGELYVGDVGDVRWEEFDKVIRGGNYGWNWVEGPEVTDFPTYAPPAASRPPVEFQAPFWSYPHATIAAPGTDPRFIGNCAIGGFVYRGTKYPSLNGKYLCADWANKHVWAITLEPEVIVEHIATGTVTGFGLNPFTGDILTLESGSGVISKLVPAPDTTAIPATLSGTGVFSYLSTMTPAAGILPYEVAAPFWSDNAIKTRWFFLPPGGVISRSTNDTWTFPVGTVWVKHFDLPVVAGTSVTRKIETRFIVKTAAGGYGLTYRWRSDLTDADLVPDAGFDTTFAVEDESGTFEQPWHYPARAECSACHNPSAGFALGFSTRQLNVQAAVAGGGIVHQLLGLSALGVFDPEFTEVTGLPRLSRPLDETATLTHRFKSYTDANCAYCHQPGAPGRGEWDGRFSTPLASSSIIDGAVLSDLGTAGSKIIVPGDTSRSILFRRVADFLGPNHPEEYHMPPLATLQRNNAGVALLERFISGLAGRTSWQVGTNNATRGEFQIENFVNDQAPGTLSLDDDFYTAGTYPAGFNQLTAPRVVAADEPWGNWERALTSGDRTNRLHFVTAGGGPMTFKAGLVAGGSAVAGVVQSGFSSHEVVVRHSAPGISTILWQGTVTAPITISVNFPTLPGPNTVEIVRSGPNAANTSYWLSFDYVAVNLLESSTESVLQRSTWQVGTNNGNRWEFPSENFINDSAPGTLGLDDDFYTFGNYPAGFNRLNTPLAVTADEPVGNWERALTNGDRTNRLHFVTENGGPMTFQTGLLAGGFAVSGVVQSGFSSHDVVVRHVAGGVSTILWQGTVTSPTTITAPFTAQPGANTVEIVRSGPNVVGTSYWLSFDYARIDAVP